MFEELNVALRKGQRRETGWRKRWRLSGQRFFHFFSFRRDRRRKGVVGLCDNEEFKRKRFLLYLSCEGGEGMKNKSGEYEKL